MCPLKLDSNPVLQLTPHTRTPASLGRATPPVELVVALILRGLDHAPDCCSGFLREWRDVLFARRVGQTCYDEPVGVARRRPDLQQRGTATLPVSDSLQTG